MDSVELTREQLEREVADLRRQLVELTAGRDRFRDLVESTSDWVWEIDRHARYTYVSPRVRDLLGREPDDLIGTTPFEVMPPAEAERVAEIYQDLLTRAEPFEHLESVCLHADGREVLMETSGMPVYGPDGTLEGYRGVDRDITERKQAQEALRANAERLELAMSLNNDGVFDWDFPTGNVRFDPRYYTMAGYEPDEFPGTYDQWALRVHEEDLPSAEQAIKAYLSGQAPEYDQEFRFRCEDGQWMWIRARIKIVSRDANGAPLRIIGTHTNITDRKRAEQALRASEERFRSLSDSAPVGIWHTDNEGRVLYTNRRWQDITGLTLAEGLGTGWGNALHPEDREWVFELWKECLTEEKGWSGEFRFVSTSGDVRWVLTNTAPIRSETGQVTGHVGSNEDITDRKRAEEALRESEEKHRTLFEGSLNPITIYDRNAVIVMINNAGAKNLGKLSQEVIGRPLGDFIPSTHEMTLERIRRALETGEPLFVEDEVPLPGGEQWFSSTLHPILNPDGPSNLVQVVSYDITERKQAEKERNHLEEQLRQAQKMEAVGQLAGGIAHDFNNILTVIKGNSELLKMTLSSAGEQVQFIDEVIKGANRAADLTGQLLAFARKSTWQAVPVDIHDSIAQTVNMLTHTIDRRIDIRLELHASPSTIMGDPTQLENALLNLGVNARDAMADGGVLTYTTRNVTLTEADCNEHPYELTPGRFLEIRVSDTGTGMDRKTQERIFEPFFTTKDVGKGTGLGLAGVYGCVKSHDGSISVSSAPGRGATLMILLPLAGEDAVPAVPAAPRDELVKGTGHILVVDDEESVRNFVATSLRSLGYTVRTCANGADAVDNYREQHREIDLVILDLIMPKMSGQDAFRRMKEVDPHVRVLVSSGFSYSQAARQMLDDGALGLLNKPFQISRLSQAVAEHIQGERAR